MALKDWKQTLDGGNRFVYQHSKRYGNREKTEWASIIIEKIDLKKLKNKWRVRSWDYNYKDNPYIRWFRTKLQALNFAKNYMKKH